jgi:hypothetical protein
MIVPMLMCCLYLNMFVFEREAITWQDEAGDEGMLRNLDVALAKVMGGKDLIADGLGYFYE